MERYYSERWFAITSTIIVATVLSQILDIEKIFVGILILFFTIWTFRLYLLVKFGFIRKTIDDYKTNDNLITTKKDLKNNKLWKEHELIDCKNPNKITIGSAYI